MHPNAALGALWLTNRGAMHPDTLWHMLEKRAKNAGIDTHLYPHALRHTFAHLWLSDGGTEGDLRAIAGWSQGSPMIGRYARGLRAERARAAHKTHSPGDKF